MHACTYIKHMQEEITYILSATCVHTCEIQDKGNHMQIYERYKQSILPTTVGSKSTNTHLGTCLPAPVSLKNVLKESSPPPIVLSLGIWPSG